MKVKTIEDNNKEIDSTPWEEFKKEIEEDLEKSQLKIFNKKFKKIKKQLRKDVKEFQPWDYDYLLRFVEHSLQAMSLFLGNKYLVMRDTEWVDKDDPNNCWKVHTAKLKECYELLKDRNDPQDVLNENKKIEKALKILSKHIFTWWD